MNDWFRSVSALGMAFVGVVVVTLGLAMVMVPGPVGSSRTTGTAVPGTSGNAEAPDPIDVIPTRVGGMLTVTGDRQGTFTVDRESIDGRFGLRYGLIGDEGRVFFDGRPLAVVQMNFDGMSFFPEPEECTIAPGQLNPAIGVGAARLQCVDVADVRGNGVVTIEGTIGIAGDRLGMRGDLPPSGGSVDIGGETLTFSEARVSVARRPAVVGGRFGSRVPAEDGDSSLGFDYDAQTHELSLVNLEVDGAFAEVAHGACAISTRELGVLNPRTTVIDVSIRCAAVDVPGLGPVPIEGSLIVEQVGTPF